ncbi:MAG: hypothetical protein Unbinned5930contig1000_31 [Prokaryotic dsDNA virus sp.]|nr:MAG: hypothetical protein Unbinned5930contig1000_31 [Prokaryotic dsDNA virus sp.]|tara:strand:- start:19 stop:429 length:411 start_codon:yes stop_codon:yes gene_type:complete
MLEIKTLNRKHTRLIDEYLTKIDETIYNATEDETSDKMLAFRDIKTRGIGFSNSLAIEFLRDDRAEDWIMMLPNFMVFSVIGFVTALKTKDNSLALTEIIDELYEYHLTAIERMERIVVEYNKKQSLEYVETKIKR